MAITQLNPSQVERYSRHLIMPNVGSKGQRALIDSKVLIIGAGGLGSPEVPAPHRPKKAGVSSAAQEVRVHAATRVKCLYLGTCAFPRPSGTSSRDPPLS